MFRTFALAALSLFAVSAATAQSRPAPKPAAPTTTGWDLPADIWSTAPATAAAAATAATEAPASRMHTDDVAYAAPGMAVHINRNPKLLPYSVRPARKTRTTVSSLAVASR